MRRTLGCVRLVYNKALHERTQGWYERQEKIGYAQTSSMLTSWKKQQDLDFLNVEHTMTEILTQRKTFSPQGLRLPSVERV